MLATFNGARTLPTVLGAYERLRAPPGGWKLVVVNNGSTDSTASVLAEFAPRLPLTRLYVGTAGKNRALNAALEHREGDLVVLTDDDAVPARDWLEQLRRAADEHPEYDVFGGAIIPRWELPPPRWLLEWVPLGITYAITPPGLADGRISASQVYGPNMAVRARLFDRGNCFDARIGPRAGSSYAMGSETEFTVRMEQRGHAAMFVSAAVVEHMIRAFQMERSWILQRAVRNGRGNYRLERQRAITAPSVYMGAPRWRVRRLLSEALAFLRCRLKGDERGAFRHAWTLRADWGYLTEARRALWGAD